MSQKQESQSSSTEPQAESSLEEEINSLSIAKSLYQPLVDSEIRLLRLKPGGWDDPICCDLLHVNLDDRPNYIALSYAWGDPTKTQPISVDNRFYNVTTSLFSALRRLRFMFFEEEEPTGNFDLWADAICINQEDQEEKALQIIRMCDIYALANTVLAWLGENPVEKDAIIQRIMEMARAVPSKPKTWKSDLTELFDRSWRDYNPFIQAIVELAARPWFTRLWVVQEAVLANREPMIFAGRAWSYMADFFDLACAIQEYKSDYYGAFPGSLNLSRFFSLALIRINYHNQKSNHEISIVEQSRLAVRLDMIIENTGGQFRASLPHDYIYGLLGLTGSKELPPTLTPDYSKSYLLVYQQYTKFIIEHTGNLSIMLRSRVQVDIQGVPSWVPDFREVPIPSRPPKDVSSTIYFSEDGNQMTLTGCDLGACVSVNIPSPEWRRDSFDSITFLSGLQQLDAFFQRISEVREMSKVGKISKDEILEDWLQSEHPSVRDVSIEDLKRAYFSCLSLRNGEQVNENKPFKVLIHLLTPSVGLSTAFVTEGGVVAYLVLTQRDAEPGDILVAVRGTAVPLLLRPTNENNNYLFVGGCEYKQPFDVEAVLSERVVKEFTLI
jgi:hypothetical protein